MYVFVLAHVFNNYHCQCMSDKDPGSRAGVHSISDGLIVMCFLVCMELNLVFVHTVKYTYVISLAFTGLGHFSPHNCLASHLMYDCDYIWNAYMCNNTNFILRLCDVSDVGNNKVMFICYFVVSSLHVCCIIILTFFMRT